MTNSNDDLKIMGLLAIPNNNNKEQAEAFLYEKLKPWLDLMFNRTEYQIPSPPPEFKLGLDILDQDLKTGNIRKHFKIDFENQQIMPVTDSATCLFVFIDLIKNEMRGLIKTHQS